MNPPETIAITGASSGLGAALAREYAAPGIRLFLAARRIGRLTDVADACIERGADVSCTEVDIRHWAETAIWIEAIEQNNPIDLLIANAGIFSGNGEGGQMESPEDLAAQIHTNLIGTATTVNLTASYMQKRQSGHIAMVSSLAALQPMADAPGYSAAKAGILAYSEALREYLIKDRVTVSVILPGHIKTAQTDVHVGDLTGIISAEDAAAVIRQRLDRGQTFAAFPQTMHLLVRLGRLLPWRLRATANRPFRFYVNHQATDQLPLDKAPAKSKGH